MSKNKKAQTTTDTVTEAAKQGGYLLLAAAATLGMLELPDHNTSNRTVIASSQPAFAVAVHSPEDQTNQLTRERDEAAPHYVSYSVAERTPSRSGKG